jgi:CheY-like chemotaxis protein
MSAPGKTGLTSRRVLVVEDEYFLADDMARALEQVGAEVVGPVPSVARALAVLASGESVDAAVLDINLRGEMVFPVADALRARGTPFVFSTGYGRASVPAAYRDVPRWEKPFTAENFAKALPGMLDLPEP